MTNDLFPKHDELASRELSSAELDAVAGGFGFGDLYRIAKAVVHVVTHAPISGTAGPVGSIIRGIRSIFHW